MAESAMENPATVKSKMAADGAAVVMTAATDPGRVRGHNEDAVLAMPECGLAVLADGMGGYNAGEVASGMATSSLAAGLASGAPLAADVQFAAQRLRQAVEKANAEIYAAAQGNEQYSGMGTTLVAALFHDNAVIAAHVGDSRLYRLRGDSFEQLTRDHSLLQEQIDSGVISAEEARFSQNRNLVTRALGVDPGVAVEVHVHPAQPGDLYLFCSDGLNDMVADEEMAMALQALGSNLELAAAQLVDMANDNGGRDNISVILARVRAPFPAPRAGWLQRLLGWWKRGSR